jgi:putative transposase
MHDRLRDSVCKTFHYQLLPTPDQAQTLETAVWRCRELYNAGLQERKAAWEKRRVCVSFAMQSAQLPAIKDVCPQYREINAQVLQEVLHRLDMAFAAFFRRVQAGAHPGYPRLQGTDRYASFTYPQVGAHGGAHGGAVVDGSMLSLSKIGRLRLRLHRPLAGTPKTVTISREADGWYACISCAEVPTKPLPPTGNETSIDAGLKVFRITADGQVVANPRHYRTAERRLARAQRRVSRRTKGSMRRRKAVQLLARKHQQVKSANAPTFTTRPHSHCCASMTSSLSKICRSALWSATTNLATSISDAGWAAFRTILEAKAKCSVRRASGDRGACSVHHSGLQWRAARWERLSAAGRQEPVSAHPHLSVVRTGARPRSERGAGYSSGRVGPSGATVARWAERRLRSPRLSPWGVCHEPRGHETRCAWPGGFARTACTSPDASSS